MKRYLSTVSLILLFCLTGWAQNLVTNPSFEAYNSCPQKSSTGQGWFGQDGIVFSPTYSGFPTVREWVSPINTSPDYFNICATTNANYPVSVPRNFAGYQFPRTGNGYAGFFAGGFSTVGGGDTFRIGHPPNPVWGNPYLRHTWETFGEFIETRLLQPMVAGHRYKVHFFVNLSSYVSYDILSNAFAMDQLGAYFSETMVMDRDASFLRFKPQVFSAPGDYITDTLNWVKVEGVFTAQGGERWLTLGRFFDKDTFTLKRLVTYDTLYVPFPPYGNWYYETNFNLSYYYIDDVCVIDMDAPVTSRKDTLLCPSSFPVTLNGRAGSEHFLWSTGDTTATIAATDSGLYWVSSMGECSYHVDTIYLKVPPKPDLGKDTSYCPDGAAVLSARASYSSYSWNTGDTTAYIVVTKSGQYILTVTDRCNMQQKDTINISFEPTPPPIVADTIICKDVIVPVLNVYGESLKWYSSVEDHTPDTVQPPINTTVAGDVFLYVTQTLACGESAPKEVKVKILDIPQVVYMPDTIVCKDAFTELTGSFINADRYLWSTGDTLCCITVSRGGDYIVSGGNVCGVSADTVHVEERDCEKDCIWLPSAFSPNGDGKNDVFRVIDRCALSGFRIMIVNRWGQVVFESKSIDLGWDGMLGDKPAEAGSYFYMVDAYPDQADNIHIKFKGELVLIR